MTASSFSQGASAVQLASDVATDGIQTPKVIVDGASITVTGLPGAYPTGATVLGSSSGNVANSSAVATLANDATLVGYLTGFEMTATGATSAAVKLLTVTGCVGGTLTYVVNVPATSAAVQLASLAVEFAPPLKAVDKNTDIVVTLPALGSGNTNACVNAHGYKV